MPKIIVGHEKAHAIAETIRQNPGRTPKDIAILANRRLDRPTIEAMHVNNFLTYHPTGQKLVKENLVATSINSRRQPGWVNGHEVSAVEDIEKKPGELVEFVQKTGEVGVDEAFHHGMNVAAEIARRLPATRQHLVVEFASTINVAGELLKAKNMVIAAQQREIEAKDDLIATLKAANAKQLT
jgi:hypothetical protein